MLTVKDKHVVVGADFAGHPLKEAVKAHLEERGWTVTDLTPDAESAPMYHRVGFALGAQIAEGKFERALAFCGTGMGIHIAASKCPHVHAAVCESVPAARRCAAAAPASASVTPDSGSSAGGRRIPPPRHPGGPFWIRHAP